MTAEGRLARGKANHEAGKFLKNPETLAYVAALPKTAKDYPEENINLPPEERKPKEKKNAKPTK